MSRLLADQAPDVRPLLLSLKARMGGAGQAAAAAGVSHSAYLYWLAGRSMPNAVSYARLVAAYQSDPWPERQARIASYARLAGAGRPLFGGGS